jgi:hypothetical protein
MQSLNGTSGGHGLPFFVTLLYTRSIGRFCVMTRVTRGNNEVTKLPKMKILMTPSPAEIRSKSVYQNLKIS